MSVCACICTVGVAGDFEVSKTICSDFKWKEKEKRQRFLGSLCTTLAKLNVAAAAGYVEISEKSMKNIYKYIEIYEYISFKISSVFISSPHSTKLNPLSKQIRLPRRTKQLALKCQCINLSTSFRLAPVSPLPPSHPNPCCCSILSFSVVHEKPLSNHLLTQR